MQKYLSAVAKPLIIILVSPGIVFYALSIMHRRVLWNLVPYRIHWILLCYISLLRKMHRVLYKCSWMIWQKHPILYWLYQALWCTYLVLCKSNLLHCQNILFLYNKYPVLCLVKLVLCIDVSYGTLYLTKSTEYDYFVSLLRKMHRLQYESSQVIWQKHSIFYWLYQALCCIYLSLCKSDILHYQTILLSYYLYPILCLLYQLLYTYLP